jgi:hypothetical protein
VDRTKRSSFPHSFTTAPTARRGLHSPSWVDSQCDEPRLGVMGIGHQDSGTDEIERTEGHGTPILNVGRDLARACAQAA